MKLTFDIILNLVIFFLLPFHAKCDLSIDLILLPGQGCDGQISITADGTAGPFEIQITSNGSITHTFLDVDGTISVTDLCALDYQVAAINRFGCSHVLGDVLFGSSSDASSTTLGLEALHAQQVIDPQVSAYPNPFSDSFDILFNGMRGGKVSITGYDNLGRILFSRERAYTKGQNQFNFNLGQLNIPEGLLMLEVLDVSSGFRSYQKLVHRRE